MLNLSASPWHAGKPQERRELFAALAKRHGVPIAFANQVGGNDELIFDGGSFFVDAQGRVRASLPLFESALEIIDLDDLPAPLARDRRAERAPRSSRPASCSASATTSASRSCRPAR